MPEEISIPSYKAIFALAWRRYRSRFWTLMLTVLILHVIGRVPGYALWFIDDNLVREIFRPLLLYPLKVGAALYAIEFFRTGKANRISLFEFYRCRKLLLISLALGLIGVLPRAAIGAARDVVLSSLYSDPGVDYYVGYLADQGMVWLGFAWSGVTFFFSYLLALDPRQRVSDIIRKGLVLGGSNLWRLCLFSIVAYMPGVLGGVPLLAIQWGLGIPEAGGTGYAIFSSAELLLRATVFGSWIMLCHAGFAIKRLNLTVDAPPDAQRFMAKMQAFHGYDGEPTKDESAEASDTHEGLFAEGEGDWEGKGGSCAGGMESGVPDENDVLGERDDDLAFLLRGVLNNPFDPVAPQDLADIRALSVTEWEKRGGPRERRMYDLAPLAYCVSLEALDLSGCEIKNIDALEHLSQLKVLNLSNNRIKDASLLGGLENLTALDLSRNDLYDTEGVSELPRLAILRIAHNRLYDVSGLENLSGLRELDVRGNGLTEEEIASLREVNPDCVIVL